MSDTKKTAPAENYADLGDFSISSRGMAKDIIKRFMRNKTAVVGLFIIVVLTVCALFPAQISDPDYVTLHLDNAFAAPSSEHLLGTDELGRDMFTRIVWGCRTSLTIGLTAVAAACVIGVGIGCVAGFYSGVVDLSLIHI